MWYKIGGFLVYFAQAYGLAFVFERMGLLLDMKDALAMALFLGVTFVISCLYGKVVCQKVSFMHFIFKAALKLLILVVMAWILVYWVNMAPAMLA